MTPDLIVVPTAKGGAVVALDPKAKGIVNRENTTHQRWRVNNGTPDVASPLIYEGLVYLSDNSGTLKTNGFSWIAKTLPFFEQGPLHSKIDFNVKLTTGTPTDFNTNFGVIQSVIPTLLCPSDPHPKLYSGGLASHNYAASRGPT